MSEPPRVLILVAEDEPSIRELLVRVLSGAGYEVVAAAGVTEALQLAEREGDSITLLLTDIVMPDGSGRELAQRLRAARPSLPVVFCSGFSDDPLVEHRELARTSAFVDKPFTADDLLAAIAQQLKIAALGEHVADTGQAARVSRQAPRFPSSEQA